MSDQWETCEIQAVYTLDAHSSQGCFWAKATGPDGEYNAGDSPPFTSSRPISQRAESQSALKTLIRELVQTGWDPIQEHGQHWYSLRFQRRITP